MAERPVLFSDAMVRAILAGGKTMTRRVVNPQPHYDNGRLWWMYSKYSGTSQNDGGFPESEMHRCPYGAPGDLLYVRECFWADSDHAPDDYPWIYYRADGAAHQHDGRSISGRAGHIERSGPWKPSIHMPRWASRILLRVTSVRVERLHDITELDARAEGVTGSGPVCNRLGPNFGHAMGARDAFRELWERINAAGSWDANPWVWVVAFEVAEVKR